MLYPAEVARLPPNPCARQLEVKVDEGFCSRVVSDLQENTPLTELRRVWDVSVKQPLLHLPPALALPLFLPPWRVDRPPDLHLHASVEAASASIRLAARYFEGV